MENFQYLADISRYYERHFKINTRSFHDEIHD